MTRSRPAHGICLSLTSIVCSTHSAGRRDCRSRPIDGTLHWRRALAGGEFQYAMRGRGQAHRLEIEVIADSAESDGENAAYEVTLDGLPLQRGEHRRIDGDPTAIDVYPLPDAIETAETAENIENTGENDNADDAAIVRISASAHDGAKITALRLHK